MTTKTKQRLMYAGAAILLGLLLWQLFLGLQRERAANRAQATNVEARVATAIDSITRLRVLPLLDSLGRELATTKQDQQAIKVSILYLRTRNENLNRHLDSINAVVGLRPDF